MKKRVIIADDESGIRQAYALVITQTIPELELVGEARDGDEALALCVKMKPDVLVTDLRLPKRDGMLLMTLLRERELRTETVIYTGCVNQGMLRTAADGQPAGLVHKTDALDEFRRALRAASSGGRFLSPTMMQLLRATGAHGEILTSREFSVLQLVMEGMVNKQIAAALECAESKEGTHRQRIMEKSGCHDAASLARWACRNGLDG